MIQRTDDEHDAGKTDLAAIADRIKDTRGQQDNAAFGFHIFLYRHESIDVEDALRPPPVATGATHEGEPMFPKLAAQLEKERAASEMHSAHDHGNCELCDWQEARIGQLERERNRAVSQHEVCAQKLYDAERELAEAHEEQRVLIDRIHAAECDIEPAQQSSTGAPDAARFAKEVLSEKTKWQAGPTREQFIAEEFLRLYAAPQPDPFREAVRALVGKMEICHDHPAYKSVWVINQLHCGSYTGPNYATELAAVKSCMGAPSAPTDDTESAAIDDGAKRGPHSP